MKYYYCTYLVNNAWTSSILTVTFECKAVYSEITQFLQRIYGAPVCITFLAETNQEDREAWGKIQGIKNIDVDPSVFGIKKDGK